MGAHAYHKPAAEMFQVSSRLKRTINVLLGVGILSIIISLILAYTGGGHEEAGHGGHHSVNFDKTRFWADILLSNWYFLGLTLGGSVFMALAYLTNAGWSVGIRRIPEAFSTYLPYAAAGFILIFVGAAEIYHWAHEGVTDPASANYDAIIAEKSAYLNLPFMIGRFLAFFAGWFLMTRTIRMHSLAEDAEGGFFRHKRNKTMAGIFTTFFGVTWAMSSWDFMMSLDPHWFSTIYWVNQFAGMWVASLSTIMLFAILLKRAGYIQFVNTSHYHDLGKLMFAFSIFWTYTWLSQFLLYYYANIPEEAVYYFERWAGFKFLFWLNLILHFLLPLLMFMTRDAKRTESLIIPVASIILAAHFLDLYLCIMPGTVGHAEAGIYSWKFILEVGIFAFFAGLWLMVVTKSLSKINLIPTGSPYLKESVLHNT